MNGVKAMAPLIAPLLLVGCSGIENPLSQQTVAGVFRESGLPNVITPADYLGRGRDGRPWLRPLVASSTAACDLPEGSPARAGCNIVVAAVYRSNVAAIGAQPGFSPGFQDIRICNVWLGFLRLKSHVHKLVENLRRKCML